MMTEWNEPQIAAKRKALAERNIKCARDLQELGAIDHSPSILSNECGVLADLIGELMRCVDAGHIRLTSALRIMDLAFDLQDDATAERKRQLGRHNRQ